MGIKGDNPIKVGELFSKRERMLKQERTSKGKGVYSTENNLKGGFSMQGTYLCSAFTHTMNAMLATTALNLTKLMIKLTTNDKEILSFSFNGSINECISNVLSLNRFANLKETTNFNIFVR